MKPVKRLGETGDLSGPLAVVIGLLIFIFWLVLMLLYFTGQPTPPTTSECPGCQVMAHTDTANAKAGGIAGEEEGV